MKISKAYRTLLGIIYFYSPVKSNAKIVPSVHSTSTVLSERWARTLLILLKTVEE